MQTHPLRRWRPARGPGPAHRPPPRPPDQADADSSPAFGSSSTTSAQDAFLASVLCIDTSCSLSNRRWCIRRPPRLCRSPHGGAVPDRRSRRPALHCTSQTGSFAGHRRRPPHVPTLDLPAAGPRRVCPPSPGRLTPSLLQARAAPAPPAYPKSFRSTRLDRTVVLPTEGRLQLDAHVPRCPICCLASVAGSRCRPARLLPHARLSSASALLAWLFAAPCAALLLLLCALL